MSIHQKYLEKLEFAALAGNLDEVERLTRNESRENIWNLNIIKKVVSAGQVGAAKLLIKRGASYSGSNLSKDNEILHSAILTGDLELVKLLISETRASVQLVDRDEIPLIFKIVHILSDNVDYSQFLDCLLARETKTARIKIINSKYQSRSFTILHYAAENGNDKIIPLLIERRCPLYTTSKDGSYALHIAAENRHSQVVRVLLEHGVKAYLVNKEQMTPLHIAVKNKDLETFIVLLNHITESGVSVKQYFHKEANRSLVYLAVSEGNTKMVELLLSNEAVHTYSVKETKQTAFHLAVEKEHIPILKLLLKYDAKLEAADKNGYTPLHLACLKGNQKIAAMFLKTKCQLNAKSNTGLTALHLAVREGHFKIVSLLLESGANYKEFDNRDKTALSFALENASRDEKILNLLLKHMRQKENNENNSVLLPEDNLLIKYHTEARNDKNENSVLHLAVEKEDKTAINTLLNLHACIDNLNEKSYTPLDLATVNGSFTIVNIFLTSRSDPKTLFVSNQEDGFTPMHFAVEEGNTDLLEVFFKAGISADLPYKTDTSVNVSKPNGLTPLHIAARNGDKNLVNLLLKNGAKVDVSGRDDFESPLFTAAENGNQEVLEILSEASTSRSSNWKEGYLPLCIAAYRGHEKVVKMFLDKRVDPNANFDTYLTPLHAAAQQGYEKIVRLLIERGAMVNPKRNSGEFISTPLLGALFAKHTRIAQLLLNHGADFNVQLLPRCKSKIPESVTNPSVLMTKQILTLGSYKDSEIGEEGSLIGYRPLHFAVEAGDKTAVKSLLNFGTSVNFKAKNGATAIGLAIEKKNEAIVKLLFSVGANVFSHHKEKSILEIEVLKTNVKLAEIVVKYIASSHPVSEDKKVTPLGFAVESELEDCVKKFLQAGADLLVEHNDESVLNIAVRKKNLAIVELLVKHGIDANYVGRDKKLALLTAVQNEDLDIIEFLLQAGANTKISKALYIAIKKKNSTIVEMFLKRGLVNSVLEADFDLNLRTLSKLRTAIYVPMSNPSMFDSDCSDFDLDYESDYRNNSPFRWALRKSGPQVVQKFLDYQVSTDVKNSKGEPPIFYAIKAVNLEVVLFLLEASASVNATSTQGEPIIHYAMRETDFNANLYQILVDQNIDLNAPNKDNLPPIIRILREQYHNRKLQNDRNCLLNVLLSNGVNPNQIFKGKTMLEYCISYEKCFEIEVLILNGADINFVNTRQKTPLQVAIDRALKISAEFETKKGPFMSRKNNSKNIENLEYDHYYTSYQNFGSRIIVRQLVREVARRLAAKEEVNEENTSSISSAYLKKYYELCNAEIDLLKQKEICTGISYFDVLVAKFRGLASYAKNIKVKQVLLSENEVLKLFPKYGKSLINRIVIGRDRRHLLDSCFELLKKFLQYNFPLLITEHILSFLGNKDLRNFCVAMEK